VLVAAQGTTCPALAARESTGRRSLIRQLELLDHVLGLDLLTLQIVLSLLSLLDSGLDCALPYSLSWVELSCCLGHVVIEFY